MGKKRGSRPSSASACGACVFFAVADCFGRQTVASSPCRRLKRSPWSENVMIETQIAKVFAHRLRGIAVGKCRPPPKDGRG